MSVQYIRGSFSILDTWHIHTVIAPYYYSQLVAAPECCKLRGHPHIMSNFFKGFLTYLPTHFRFCPIEWDQFYLVVSDFCKPTYLLKNRTSYVDDPYPLRILNIWKISFQKLDA